MPTDSPFTCATCDHITGGHPVLHLGLAFCCPGCAVDGPCICSYDTDQPHPPHDVANIAADGPTGDRGPVEVPAAANEAVSLVNSDH